jgi:two-component system cell cycle response regulator
VSAPPAWVLVVDDDATDRLVLFRLLERFGHHATVAEDGRRALELLRAEPFDLVLLDLMMPDSDGYAVLEAMKDDSRLRAIPVIMTSAVDRLDAVVRCIELGADDYLDKPVDPVLLRARVEAVLTNKRLREREDDYNDVVGRLLRATAALSGNRFDAESLDFVARRLDPLGQLARTVTDVATQMTELRAGRTTGVSSEHGGAGAGEDGSEVSTG